jgi:hypothetical protein
MAAAYFGQLVGANASFDAGRPVRYTSLTRVRPVYGRAAAHTADVGEGSWPRD